MTARSGPAPRVAYQGESGAFSEAAVLQHWKAAVTPVATRSFDALLESLCTGDVDFGVLPVWNSAIGDVGAARAALAANGHALEIVDDVALPVRHCLLALPGATLQSVRTIGSHPAALAQCTRFLGTQPWIRAVTAYDTAGAARELALHGRSSSAAASRASAEPWFTGAIGASPDSLGVLASAVAAERYGLAVLAEAVQDDPSNTTRFVVLRRREAA